MDCSMPGSSVVHFLPEFAQIHVHWGGDAIQPSYHLPPPSPFTFYLSQHQGLFQWVGSLHGGQSIGASTSASVLLMNIQGSFPLGLTGHIHTLLYIKEITRGICLAIQWLRRLHASNSGGTGSTSGWGTKIPHAVGCFQKKKIGK